MKRFLKQLTVIALGTLIGGCILFVLLLGLIIGIPQYALKTKKDKITDHSVLKVQLNGKLVETVEQPLLSFFSNERSKEISLLTLKDSIQKAKSDDKIAGIYVEIGELIAGWGNLAELRNALQSFKESGKFIIAYGENYSTKSYYTSSLANEIILHPSGTFNFIGLQLTVLFYKQLLEKLGITPQVFKVGQYKSAIEPFTSQSMSEANKEQCNVLLDHMYTHLLQTVATDRKLAPESVKALANTLAITAPQKAHQAGLVTQIGYKNQVEEWIQTKLQLPPHHAINFVDANSYHHQTKQKTKKQEAKIAILIASGVIVDKEEVGANYITPQAFSKTLRKLRADKHVKAIVLRINSPGGAVLASDTIWNELMLTKKQKPIVASMSDVAASGGYYLATACDHIVAYPTTITGSIGIYGLFFDVHALLQNKLGITGESVKTNTSADFLSLVRPFYETEKASIQQRLETSYDSFLNKVVAGRHLTRSKVERLAQGRVWPGDLAHIHGLVDQLGGLDKAIEQAASLAGLQEKSYQVVQAPKHEYSWLKTLLVNECNEKMKAFLPLQFVAPYLQLQQPFEEVINRQGQQSKPMLRGTKGRLGISLSYAHGMI
eukprot:gene1046-1328_t